MAIHIVVSITKKIAWYILILFACLVGFTHALVSMYVHRSCVDGSCTDADDTSKGPIKFSRVLETTFFFMVRVIIIHAIGINIAEE